jgi:cell division protein FtsL
MLRLKIIISTIIFLILLIITSIIKNQTRIIEKKLFKLNEKITLKEKDINESQLDFYFLTSPAEIEEKIKILGQNNYSPIENSKIFLSLSNFTEMQKKISVFKNLDEKKTKKN